MRFDADYLRARIRKEIEASIADARAAAIEECAEICDKNASLCKPDKFGDFQAHHKADSSTIRKHQPNPNWLAEHDRKVRMDEARLWNDPKNGELGWAESRIAALSAGEKGEK